MSRPNKFPGVCKECHDDVPAGTGIITPGRHRRWEVLCGTCGAVSPDPDRIVCTRIGGQTFTRNTRGRCEDAPCCGCCTF